MGSHSGPPCLWCITECGCNVMSNDKGHKILSFQSTTRDTLDSTQDIRYLIFFLWGEPSWVEVFPLLFHIASIHWMLKKYFQIHLFCRFLEPTPCSFCNISLGQFRQRKERKGKKSTFGWLTEHTLDPLIGGEQSLFRAKLPKILKSKRETWRYFRGTVGL